MCGTTTVENLLEGDPCGGRKERKT